MSKINYITPIGDDFIIPLSFFEVDGVTPANINGASIELLLKPFDDLSDSDASVIVINGVITNASGGLATVSIANAVTVNYSGTFYYKLKITTGSSVIITFAYGVVTFTLRGSTQIANQANNALVVNLGTGVTVSGSGAYYTWQTISGASQALVTGNAYINQNAGLTTFTLPATAAVGDHFIISGFGAGGWKLGQNASQSIQIGNNTTTVGTGGSLASTNKNDVIEIVCVTANTGFQVTSSYGNITVT